MPHEYAGQYSSKHPPGTRADATLTAALREVVDEGRISCAAAHDVAVELAVAPAEVGKTIDLLDHRIAKCQMGLFGYSPEKKIVKPAGTVSNELRDQLTEAAVDGRVSCAACWDIAQDLGVQKIAVAAACETLGLSIKPCQLGAF